MKIFFIIILILGGVMLLFSFLNGGNIYEPPYRLIAKSSGIEIREYDTLLVAMTKKTLPYKEATTSGFRTLASYIFGNNKENIQIPMTAPVLTSMPDTDSIEISFVMSKSYSIKNIPTPNSDDVIFKKVYLGKTAVIKFGMWANPEKIMRMKAKLDKYIANKNLITDSDYLVAQYNSPWVPPPFRRNEIIISIKKD